MRALLQINSPSYKHDWDQLPCISQCQNTQGQMKMHVWLCVLSFPLFKSRGGNCMMKIWNLPACVSPNPARLQWHKHVLGISGCWLSNNAQMKQQALLLYITYTRACLIWIPFLHSNITQNQLVNAT